MGLLSVEERGRLQDVMETPESEEPAGVQDPVTSETQPVEASGSEESSEAEEAVEASEVEEEGGHQVPYDRFRTINDQRKSAVEERDALRGQLEEMRQQLGGKQSKQSEAAPESSDDDSWLDSLLGEEEDGDGHSDRFSSIEDRIAKFEVAQARVELTEEVGAARTDYPGVPEELLLQAVIQDPTVNVREVAEHYSAFIASIEEAALARHVKGGKSVVEEKAAPPPRPHSTGSSGGNDMLGADDARPTTLKDASSAARQWLSKAGW